MFLRKKIALVIMALLANFEAKRNGNGAKIKIVFYKHVLEFVLAPITPLDFSIFSKNVKIVVPY